MVNFLVRVMFSTLMIDLSIGFAWIGVLGWMELRDSFNKAFPDAHLGDKLKAFIKRIYEHFKENKKSV